MVEHNNSFRDDSNEGSVATASQSERDVASTNEQSARIAGQFDDASADSLLVDMTSTLTLSEEGLHTVSTDTSNLQDLQVGSRGGDSRFDDATENSHASGVSPLSPPTIRSTLHPSRCCWSDEEVEQTLVGTLITDSPQNVLDMRRQWPNPPVPDTRQFNRTLYKLRDEGAIEQCPPNGNNQKPCWKRQSA